ncbi:MULTISPECIES: CHASE2 domain-containing protein [Nostoc]|uniref:CHASE2 domain-containing protein n=2 Tax=Nostoc TaxID=1177 RepID=A0ABR8IAP1_9NOSO|nr:MULTISPECIES: CHASE2 domain-containing protein [Nostoc]MBD2560312.1 CHASE2 domain-containing protein [Nostoc linckia FACHB-391]MBD2648706.1 CHASE2 domain-containing protein [Nostoc foliaceum FACHB-393]
MAYHAAFPLALTPDLLYRLWANFQQDIHGEMLGIPWVAVADLLLSNLCDEVGHELYEIDLAVRNELLNRLKEDEKFGQQRIQELSNFMLYYVQQQIQSDDLDVRDFAQTQRWIALAYTQPSHVAKEIALEFSKLGEKNTAELVRIASLTETLTEQLAGFKPLLSYVDGIKKFVRGDIDAAKAQFSEAMEGGNQIQVAGVSLPIPEQLQDLRKNKSSPSRTLLLSFKWLKELISKRRESPPIEFQKLTWQKFRTMLFSSLGLTTFIVVLRILGVFQNSEISLFDQMMRLRPLEEPDKRLLVVKITREDIEYYARNSTPKNGASLSDEIIHKLLSALLKNSPRVIGMDIYRYAKAEGKLTELIREKQTDKHLVFICKFPDYISNSDGRGRNPPPDVPLEQVGLSDFIYDDDGVIRRQLIQMGTPTTEETQNSTCRNPEPYGLMNSFSLQVAQKYLNENMESGFSVVKPFDNILKPLDISKKGGYSLKNLDGFQILLNYRYTQAIANPNSHSLRNIAPQFTVQQILEVNSIDESFVKDKIVLIGTTAEGYDQIFKTPFSSPGSDQAMEGLFIQAQMVSQLVSAVEDGRPLIRVSSLEYEILWILFWSFIGAILAQLFRTSIRLIISGVIALASLYIICLILFISPIQYWIPFYSPAMSFLTTSGVVYIRFQKQKSL